MASSFKPPHTPRNPTRKKENLDEARLDKRPRLGAQGKMVGPTNPRSRPVLSTINPRSNTVSGAGNSDSVSDAASVNGCLIEITCKEDVQKVLAERFKGKKMDFKAKSEYMIEQTKKLKICIEWYMELAEGYLAEQDRLRNLLESARKQFSEHETELNGKIEELNKALDVIRKERESLEDLLSKQKDETLATIESYEREKELKISAESLASDLRGDLEKVREELKSISDQLKMVQDTNKRLTEYNTSLQHYNSNLQSDAVKNAESLSKIQKEKSAMMETIASLKDSITSLNSQLLSSRSSQQESMKQREEMKKEMGIVRNELQQVREDRDRISDELHQERTQLVLHKELSARHHKDLDSIVTRTTALEEACGALREQNQSLQRQLAAANEKYKLADMSSVEALTENEELKNLVKMLQIDLAEEKLRNSEGEKLRKKLHNTILELKGNIRVFCRVRPLHGENELEGSAVSFPSSLEAAGRGIDLTNQAQKYSFTFDKVFGHESSQEEVFVEISQLVQSALDGYKVCIFAYGQTGSGKTYTMMGNPQSEERKGLIPRSLEQIFEASQALQCQQGWSFRMQASMLEIYNESIRDLLLGPSFSSDANGQRQYSIKHDANGNTMVSDLTVVDVHSARDVSYLLQQAAQMRSVGRTQMNEQSSRSHFVFTLRIFGNNERTEQQVQGVLNLIDLAGSERLAKSGSTGDRLKETQAINKSLSALSDVISALSKKEDHIPYRNSKLTYLLQPCLGGDSKTLMFVNVSPEASSAGESLCSLRFAARVNSCEIGIPRRQTQHTRSITDSRLSYG